MDRPIESVDLETRSIPLPSRLKILLVEDDVVDAMTVRRALAEARIDSELVVRQTGADALAWLRDAAGADVEPLPDVVILDLNLPLSSGHDLLESIKKIPALGGIPSVVLTTSGDERDVTRAFEAGAAGYFVKPVDFGRFVALMGTLCRYWAMSVTPRRIGAETPGD